MLGKLKERVGTALERVWPKKREGTKKPEQVAVPAENASQKVEAKPAKDEKKPAPTQSTFGVNDGTARGKYSASKVLGPVYRFFRGVVIAVVVGAVAGTVAAIFSPLLLAFLPAAPQFGVFSVAAIAAAISGALAFVILLSRRH